MGKGINMEQITVNKERLIHLIENYMPDCIYLDEGGYDENCIEKDCKSCILNWIQKE